jgi:hypothetical protein
MGAYEFQGTNVAGFISWLAKYGLATDGSCDYADSDGDRASNYAEWRASTNPKNANSVLRLQAPTIAASDVTVTWQSVTNVIYYLQCGTNLSGASVFSAPLQPVFAEPFKHATQSRPNDSSIPSISAPLREKKPYGIRLSELPCHRAPG